ncbi:substrate-binding domain-containing protein [Arthrobacter sp. ISL-65]|uniref:substrate-binding domain-containing protein n=1 Tax=Arthrobacter sp. ISL-65 TaxID=2819112 RepID=UPI001BEBC8F5|nr:substrate-binding domain-containing protein [Arthrobacter sp. ISL-65]MBT2547697.1 LysR family transcriptional regulator substrate-binding protein [Arthrobacter sp. ISL-65]
MPAEDEPTLDPALPESPRELRFAYVPGVTPGKWIRRWEERMPHVPLRSFMSDGGTQLSVLRDGSADLSFVRLPVEREGLNVIPLYEEQPVVVAPKGHEITVFEDVALEDLAAENFLDADDLGGPEMALQVVASGAGLLILPMSVARHFNIKDTVARRLTGAPGTQIALAWPSDATDEVIEEFIGIVRGRTAQSSRQPSAQQEPEKKAPKPDRRGGTGAGAKKPKVAQRYAPNPDKGRGRGSRKKGKR